MLDYYSLERWRSGNVASLEVFKTSKVGLCHETTSTVNILAFLMSTSCGSEKGFCTSKCSRS